MFEAFGIDRSDEQIYLHLIRSGPATIAALTAATGQGRRAARAAVSRLRTRGLAHLSPPPHEQVIAVPIEFAVDHLIRQRRSDLELVRHSATRLAAELRRDAERSPEQQIVVLSGRPDALQQLHLAAQQEFRMLVHSASFMQQSLVIRSGIGYRVVCDTPGQSLGADIQTRLVRAVPADVALADNAGALVHLDSHVLLVRPSRLLDALNALFEVLWATATPAGDLPDELDSLDRAVLSLLVAGLTDDAVGARLGMSRRTVARRVQRLMQATGAHSRFQLGWWARERNWLP